MGLRGRLTQQIRNYSRQKMGYELDTTELRLMPYILTVMMNEQKIDPAKCNRADRYILLKWRDIGYIEGSASGLNISREFWDILCEVVFMGYVDID